MAQSGATAWQAAVTPANEVASTSPLDSARQRRLRASRWVQLWEVGGTEADTTFYAIVALIATQKHVVVADAGRRRIVGLDPETGRERWRTGRPGRGPGEIGAVVQLSPLRTGGFVMIDGGNRRIRRYTESGEMTHEVAFPLGSSPLGVCARDSTVLITSLSAGRELVEVDWAGRIVRSWTLPWADAARIPLLLRQTMLFHNGESETCLQTMSFGPHLALWGPSGVKIASWIANVPLAGVETRRGGAQRLARGARLTTKSAAAFGTDFAVLFRSGDGGDARILDVYDGTTGAYRYSLEPPRRADFVAAAPGGFVLAGEAADGSPFVARFQARTRSAGEKGSVD